MMERNEPLHISTYDKMTDLKEGNVGCAPKMAAAVLCYELLPEGRNTEAKSGSEAALLFAVDIQKCRLGFKVCCLSFC